MDDKAHILLVDSHSEGDSRHHDVDAVMNEVLLHPVALLHRQSGMIDTRRYPVPAQLLRQLIGHVARQAIDDSALMRMPPDDIQNHLKPLPGSIAALHVQTEVRTVERTDKQFRITQMESFDNVPPRHGVRGCRQGQNRYIGVLLLQKAQQGIFRTEVVSPVRDAMCLIDGKQGYPDPA